MSRELTARIDASKGDGTFEMILVTEGEASDGDILSIKGGHVPARMPLLMAHAMDPTATLGSVTDSRKNLDASPPELRATGSIEMEGEGTLGEIRRDVAFMIGKGHISAVSIRWDGVPGKEIRRVNLPADHFAFVDQATEQDWRKRSGVFFEEWVAREGSVVALGADPKALIGRSKETTGDVSTFWRVMAEESLRDPMMVSLDTINDGIREVFTADAPARLQILAAHLEAHGWTPPNAPARESTYVAEMEELAKQWDVKAGKWREGCPRATDSVVEALSPEPVIEPPTVSAPRVRWEPDEVARELDAQMQRRGTKSRDELAALVERAQGKLKQWTTKRSPTEQIRRT